jgi:hypothetical protein
MKTFHPAIRFLTATVFIVLMFGFVALKSGAFDSKRARLKLNVARAGKSFHLKSGHELYTRTLTEAKGPEVSRAFEIDNMIASSKMIVATPVHWGSIPGVHGLTAKGMMSSSKSSLVVDQAELYSVYNGIFSMPYGWKAKSRGEQLKQGKK